MDLDYIKSDNILTYNSESAYGYNVTYNGTYNGKFFVNNYDFPFQTDRSFFNWYTNKVYKYQSSSSNKTYELTFNISIEEL